jgi:hypothetical protein
MPLTLYTLIDSGWSRLTKADQEQAVAAHKASTNALKQAGVLTGVNRLQPRSTATTIIQRRSDYVFG